MTHPNWIDSMEDLEKAATEGPWEESTAHWSNPIGPDEIQGAGPICTDIDYSHFVPTSEQAWKDAAFIAASREFVPKALECLSEAKEMAEKYKSLNHHGYEVKPGSCNCKPCSWLAKWSLE